MPFFADRAWREELKAEFQEPASKEEISWRQKSKVKWIKKGETIPLISITLLMEGKGKTVYNS